jgi:hypothetical protein
MNRVLFQQARGNVELLFPTLISEAFEAAQDAVCFGEWRIWPRGYSRRTE